MKNLDGIPEESLHGIHEIEQDYIHGSTFLTKKSIDIIIEFTESIDFSNYQVKDIENKYVPLLSSLINAQPQMGLIFTIANEFLFFLDSWDNKKSKESIISYLIERKENISSNIALFSNYLKNIIPENKMILTYSSGSSIIDPLIQLSKEGVYFKVICSESRPRNEGIITAKTLANHSIPVTLCTDAYLFSHIDLSDIVLIGADAICQQGIVNKTGSLPLINLAKQFDIPRYVLCDSRKIIPYAYELPIEQMKPSEDITNNIILENLSIANNYFDYTPLDYFSYVISEQGFISIPRIKEQMNKSLIHETLLPSLF